MAQALKLVEEVGEFCNEILGHHGYQRKKKLGTMEQLDLEKECADVFLTLCIVARKHNIDIEKAITEKIKVLKTRSYTD